MESRKNMEKLEMILPAFAWSDPNKPLPLSTCLDYFVSACFSKAFHPLTCWKLCKKPALQGHSINLSKTHLQEMKRSKKKTGRRHRWGLAFSVISRLGSQPIIAPRASGLRGSSPRGEPQDNLRPVIYYLKHLLQDMDEEKMLSRALISYVLISAVGTTYMDGELIILISFCTPKLGEALWTVSG